MEIETTIDKIKHDWIFGLLFYGEKVSRNQMSGVANSESSVIQIIKYANEIENLLDEMTEQEWDEFGRDRARTIVFMMGYMRNFIRMNGKTYYSIMAQTSLKSSIEKEYLEEFTKWLADTSYGVGLNKFNSIEFTLPERR